MLISMLTTMIVVLVNMKIVLENVKGKKWQIIVITVTPGDILIANHSNGDIVD